MRAARRLALLLTLPASGASAHAFLDVASPPVGGSGPAPHEVAITFTQAIEPAFTTIHVVNAAGQRVDNGPPQVQGNPHHLAVPVATLPPGAYHVYWRAISVDTHQTQGDFMFTVTP